MRRALIKISQVPSWAAFNTIYSGKKINSNSSRFLTKVLLVIINLVLIGLDLMELVDLFF
ncbi:MAG: hypothetical protein AB8B73_12835 [Ekhidna sp.]